MDEFALHHVSAFSIASELAGHFGRFVNEMRHVKGLVLQILKNGTF